MLRFPHVLLAATMAAGSASAADVTSFFPARGAAQFLVANFDLASIRSSFGPRRAQVQRTFSSLGQLPTRVTDDEVEFDGDTWYYGMRILRRGDLNRDGIEDLEVCFIDRAKQGSYDTQKALLITRYSSSSLAVALSFELDGCETIVR